MSQRPALVLRALLVEDNPGDSDLILEYAESSSGRRVSFEVRHTLSDAAEAARTESFDAILLDLGLPDSQGLETVEAMKKVAPQVPLLILTGDNDMEMAYECIERGAHDYLVKGRVEKFIAEAIHNAVARANVQRDLKAAHDNIKRMLSASHDAIVVLDSQDRVMFTNQAATDLLGHRASQGQEFSVRPELECHEMELTKTDGSRAVVEITTGETTWYGASARVLNFREITARKLAESAVRAQRDFAESLLQTADAVVLVLDLEGRVVRLNRSLEELCGLPQEKAEGKDWIQEFVPAEDQAEAKARLKTAAQGGTLHSTTFRVRAKDQSLRLIEWRDSVLRDNNERVVGVLAIGHDVTDRVKAEQERDYANTRLKLALSSASVGLWDYSPKELKAHFSEECQRQLGYEQENFPHEVTNWVQLLHPDDTERAHKHLTEFLKDHSGRDYSIELRLKHRDGTYRWMLFRGAAIESQDGQVTRMLGCQVDITERRHIELQLAQSDRLASMGMLAAGVAHEINNPLTYVLFSLESVLSDLPQSPQAEELLECLHCALEGTNRIRDIARDLGAFSRVESENLVSVSLSDVARIALNMARNEIRYRAQLHIDLQSTPEVLVNEGRLSQVVLNLLINAAHSIPEGDVENNTISLTTLVSDKEVCLAIKDTGSGIPSENLSRLFDPFFTTKEVGVGSGLGLAISKNIVESYKGRIEVESEEQVGSTFKVWLPAISEDSSPRGEQSERLSLDSHSGRILIVDDEATIRTYLAKILKKHQTVLAESGAEARRILREDSDFDIILSDLMMPELSGMELHQWLRDTRPNLARKVVFMTGGAFTPFSQEYLSNVDNLRLEKPLERDHLRQVIREQLHKVRDGTN